MRTVDVLARDESLIRHAVGALEHPLGRYAAGQRVRKPPLARDHGEQLSSVLVEQAPRFLNTGRQIGQMLEDVDSEIAIESPVVERKSRLAVADYASARADGSRIGGPPCSDVARP